MGILTTATKELKPRGRHIVIHGIGGCGKTTFASNAAKDNGLLIQLGEDGLSQIQGKDVSHIDIGCNIEPGNISHLADAFVKYQDILKELIIEKHDYKVIVQEPLSTLMGNVFEGFVVKTHYAGDYTKANSYGSKFQEYQTEFNKIIEAYKVILNRGIDIFTLLHSNPVDYKDPSTESYRKWEFVLPIGSKVNLAAQLFNHADAVFFGCYDVTVVDNKAIGGKRRILKTTPEASYTAKPIRLPFGTSIPEQILFDYVTLKTLLQKKG